MELKRLYELWDQLRNVPMDKDGTKIIQPFLHFQKGTPLDKVWSWFEDQNPEFIAGEVMQGIRKPTYRSHYDWLEKHLEAFFTKLSLPYHPGIISAHGDKCYTYRYAWDKHGIPFEHGVAIYLLSYVRPFDQETRETKNGWVSVEKWVIDNYQRFLPYLDKAYSI